jgi:hypothetical protein
LKETHAADTRHDLHRSSQFQGTPASRSCAADSDLFKEERKRAFAQNDREKTEPHPDPSGKPEFGGRQWHLDVPLSGFASTYHLVFYEAHPPAHEN